MDLHAVPRCAGEARTGEPICRRCVLVLTLVHSLPNPSEHFLTAGSHRYGRPVHLQSHIIPRIPSLPPYVAARRLLHVCQAVC